MPNRKIPIAILGATGAVGQRMIQLLAGHPWFEIAALTGSDRTVGRPYGELVRWVLDDAPPADIARMIVQPSDTVQDVAIALSALPTDVAKEIEPLWAARVAVCSNASTYRMAADVPLIIPEVNADHLAMIERQRAERGWQGCLITNPELRRDRDRDGAQAAARCLWREDRPCRHAPGGLGRGLPRRGLARHS